MNLIKNLTLLIVILVFVSSCKKDVDNIAELNSVTGPSNVAVFFDISQDNSGLVTIIPNAEGVTSYLITFGDVTDEKPTKYNLNDVITHIYSEGVYTVGITAVGLTGLTSGITKEINVSFKVPENLDITVENDITVSKQVNISATADYATVIEFYFGEVVGEIPMEALPGETVSYIYENPGDYSITVVAKSGNAETLDSTFIFTVTEITGPQVAAPEPPGRVETDVISIFSGAYSNIPNTDFNPNWGQSTIVSFEEIDGDSTIIYSNLNYQGTQFENSIDAFEMEFLHIDMWTYDATDVNVYLISTGPAEKAYNLSITNGQWLSYDIPLTEFSDVVDIADIIQLKFDGTEGSEIYLDNIYIYRQGASTEPSLPLDFESSVINYDWVDFDGGAVTIIDNPQISGINTSSKVAQMIKSAGQTWGGSWIALDAPIDFSVNKTFKMKVFSPRTGAKVLLKVENMDVATINYEVELTTTVADAWEEITFDFSAIDNAESYQKIVIIFDNGTAGDGSPNFTFLFDDIELTN